MSSTLPTATPCGNSMGPGLRNPTVFYTEAMMNGFGEGQLPKRFATDEYQVLVVAEKHQTGFDRSLLHTTYVDRRSLTTCYRSGYSYGMGMQSLQRGRNRLHCQSHNAADAT